MLEKSCKTCGCPLFEVKGKTICIVCAENEAAKKTAKGAKAPAAPAAVAEPHVHHVHGEGCGCGGDHDEDSCTCGDDDDGMLTDEVAMTVFSLCERIQNEKDPDHVLTLMQAVKAGTEALEILCRL